MGPLVTIIEHSVRLRMSEIDRDYLSVLIKMADTTSLIKMGGLFSYFDFETYMENYICEVFYAKDNFTEIMGYVESPLTIGNFQYWGHTDDTLWIGVNLL